MGKSKNKVWFDFSGFTELADKFTNLYKHTDEIANESLKASHQLITDKVSKDIQRHTVTGKTAKSIYVEPKIEKEGQDFYSVKIGFDINNGGLPSIFLMYGTPKMKPDRKFRSDLYGKKTKQENFEIQNKIFHKYIDELGD